MNFREQLADAMRGKVVVMGIGNPCRGDDAAGSWVAQQVSGIPGASVIDAQEVPEDYLSRAAEQKPDTILLIDAVDMKTSPGSVALLNKNQAADYCPSTHRVPITLLAEYLEQIAHARVFVLGIQPKQTDFLEAMSAEVASSVKGLVDVLKDAMAAHNPSASVELTNASREKVFA